jgi:hypothetical protein
MGIAALVLVIVSGVLWFRAAGAVQLPENRSLYVAAWLGGIALAGLSLSDSSGWPEAPAAMIAILGSSFLLLTVAISRQKVGESAIRLGDSLPEFSAVDEHGVGWESSSLIGQPVLLKFFRGHW